MPNPPWRWHAASLAIYAALALALIGHCLARGIVGQGNDPLAFIWLLAWWPFALSHHLDPLYTNLVWQPLGVYLPWVASVPLLALASAPVTLLCGPVLSYNILVLCAPALSAWLCYFLCLRLSRSPLAALFGGYFFGFSSYEMAQDTAALNLSVTLLVPAILLVILRRLDDELSRRQVIAAAALLLAGQFMISAEIFATIFLFGGLAWALALYYLPARRAVLLRLFVDLLLAAPPVVLFLSPFLVTMFSHFHYVHLPAAWPYFFTADLANVVLPTRMNAIGGDLFGLVSPAIIGHVGQEEGAYIGLPLLAIIFLFARGHASNPACRLLITLFLLLLLASFGPHLWIANHFTPIGLPWALFVPLPLIGAALPARFAMFVSLTAAIMASLWIAAAAGRRGQAWRIALALAAALALLPAPFPWQPIPHSRFFQPGIVQAALGPNARILILPFASIGPAQFWQLEAGFSFAQTGGYLGFPPAQMQNYPAVQQLFGNFQGPNFANDLQTFCAATKTQYVIAGPGTPPQQRAQLAALHWPSHPIADVTVFTVTVGGEPPPARSGGSAPWTPH